MNLYNVTCSKFHVFQFSSSSNDENKQVQISDQKEQSLFIRPTDDHMDAAPPDDQERSLALFPNAFPVTGIKHIADNIVGAILENLPQLLGWTLMT